MERGASPKKEQGKGAKRVEREARIDKLGPKLGPHSPKIRPPKEINFGTQAIKLPSY